MKKKAEMSSLILIGIGFLLLLIMTLTRSCFYAPNQPLLRQTGELVDRQKSGSYYYGYGFFKRNIYYWRNLALGDTPEKLNNVDKETFVILANNIAKDKNRAYYKSVSDTHVDVPTFEAVSTNGNLSVRDKNHVYYLSDDPFSPGSNNRVFLTVPDADPATYQQLENGWSKDAYNAYLYFKKIDADPQTFVTINNDYSKDKDYLYYRTGHNFATESETVGKEKCHTGELVLIPESSYIHTKTKVYYLNDKHLSYVPVNDTASIEIFNQHMWLKVDGKVVLKGAWLDDPQVDEKSFVSLDWGFFKDKNHVYFWKWNTWLLTLIDGADVNTFVRVGDYYAKDKNHVFYKNKTIPDANPNDFRYDKKTDKGYSGEKAYDNGEKVIR